MKTFLIVLLAVLAISNTSDAITTYQLDLKRSIDRISNQINVTKQNPPQWHKLDKIIDGALDCLSGLTPPESLFKVADSKWMPPILTHYVETVTVNSIATALKAVDWSAVSAKQSKVYPQNVWDDLEEFMKSAEFERIHRHIWTGEDHEELEDFLKFLHGAKFPEVYDNIKQFYIDMKRGDLTSDLPNGPTPPEAGSDLLKVKTKKAFHGNGGNRFPNIIMNIPTIKAECSSKDLPGTIGIAIGIIEELNASKIHEVIKVFLYILQEVIGNVAMHVMLLKLGEPHKGAFVHNTLELDEVKDLGMVYIQGIVLSEPSIGQLNEILKQVTGLDLWNIELFKYITNLIQYVVWGFSFPEQN